MVFITVSLIAAAFVHIQNPFKRMTPDPPRTANTAVTRSESEAAKIENKPRELRRFTGEEFKQLFLKVSYPNTQPILALPPITGHAATDARIRAIAESRGYRLSAVPVSLIRRINEPRLDNDDLLQPLAADGWHALKAAAQAADIPLSLSSAYRSPEYQRRMFLQRLIGNGASIEQVVNGQADHVIEATLMMTAIPGYSRHHTGYTIDVWCEDGSATFLNSRCFRWLSADNYKIAKKHGWIPSYPPGADMQGPEPEPWEYVWVGEGWLQE